ncbi:MAG: cysteine peptidase family C39 domain-containing protein [Gemmatimonadota bacterium]
MRHASHPLGRRRRRLARRVLLGCVVWAVGVASLSSDPFRPGRWAYRATIRARGGTFVSFPGAVLQSGATDCGPAALATLLHTLGGSSPSTDSIAKLAGTGVRGTVLAGLARAARTLGVANELRRLDAAAMDALNTPVIAWVDGGHFVTVVPDSGAFALVLDPQAGPYRIRRTRLRRYWGGEALVPHATAVEAAVAHPSSHQGGTT